MSYYTTQLRWICEDIAKKRTTCENIDEIISSAAPVIFNFEFPIFDESYKIPLAEKILLAYYTKEIGFETVGLWKIKLRAKLREIMPYYNQLYSSELLKFNPFVDTDVIRLDNNLFKSAVLESASENFMEILAEAAKKHELNSNWQQILDSHTQQQKDASTSVNNTSTSAESVGKHTKKYSDTPQGSIQDLENDTYLTNATIENDKTTSTGDSNGNSHSDNDSNQISQNLHQNNSGSNGINNTLNQNQRNNLGNNQRQSNTLNNSNDIVKTIGKAGTVSYSQLLKEFRETFLNIDQMVIQELNPLFMMLWGW